MPLKGGINGLAVRYSGHISIRMRPYATVHCAQERTQTVRRRVVCVHLLSS